MAKIVTVILFSPNQKIVIKTLKVLRQSPNETVSIMVWSITVHDPSVTYCDRCRIFDHRGAHVLPIRAIKTQHNIIH